MPKQQFAIEKGGPKRVAVSWSGMWNNVEVTFDGAVVGRPNGRQDLKNGCEFPLTDGSKLQIKLETGFGNAGLKVFRNGEPLPGSAADPEAQIRVAGGIVYFIAALNLAIGVATFLFDVKFLKDNFGAGPIVMALIFAPLGFFTMKRSRVALILALAIYAIDAIATLVTMVSSNSNPNFGFIVMRVLLIVAMVRGVKAMGELKAKEAVAPAPVGQ